MASLRAALALPLLCAVGAHYDHGDHHHHHEWLALKHVKGALEKDGCYKKFGGDAAKCDEAKQWCKFVKVDGDEDGFCMLRYGAEDKKDMQALKKDKQAWIDAKKDKQAWMDAKNAKLRSNKKPGSMVMCPFLAAMVPETKDWQEKPEAWVAAAAAGDEEALAAMVEEDAQVQVLSTGVEQLRDVKGRDAVMGVWAEALEGVDQLRLKALYPDLNRTQGLVVVEAFKKDPRTGQRYAAEWAMDLKRISDRDRIERMAFYKQPWQAVGEPFAGAQEDSVAVRVAAALGRVVGKQDCSELAALLDERASLEIADTFFHKQDGNPYELTEEVTSVAGRQQIMDYCNGTLRHWAKLMPLQYLNLKDVFEARGGAILTGSMTMKVIFSPQVKDWEGAISVELSPSNSSLVSSMKLYPIEAVQLNQKWAWKYDGQVPKFARLARITRLGAKAVTTIAHNQIASLAAVATILPLLFCAMRWLCCCGVCKLCRGRRVEARELETPLSELRAQG